MEDIKIVTPSGYTAFVHPFLTYDQYIEINKLWTRGMEITPGELDAKGKPVSPKMGKIDINLIHEANKLAISFLLVKILDKEGKEIQRAADSVPLPVKDSMPIINKITALEKEAADAFEGEKK